jgi:predicted transcriptional regulator
MSGNRKSTAQVKAEILHCIVEHDHIHGFDIAKRTGLSVTSVYGQCMKMVITGELDSEDNGRATFYSIPKPKEEPKPSIESKMAIHNPGRL